MAFFPPFPANPLFQHSQLIYLFLLSLLLKIYTIQQDFFLKGQTPGNLWNVGKALLPQSYIKKFNYQKITV